jgi:hypothetical protein
MGFRRTKTDVQVTRRWNEFVTHNADLIAEATLSLAIVADERHWLYFLDHGTLFPENDYFCVETLNEDQTSALVELTARYFESCDCEYFKPDALNQIGQLRTLRKRLGHAD